MRVEASRATFARERNVTLSRAPGRRKPFFRLAARFLVSQQPSLETLLRDRRHSALLTASVMTLLEELQWRGLYADCTDSDALAKRLAQGPLALYCGFDPTADSLHVGNLVPLFAMRRFQMAGHHPIALAGGATGMVGDPSGKSAERNLQTPEQVAHNIATVKAQLAKFLDFNAPKNPARLVNNYDWTGPVSVLEFL